MRSFSILTLAFLCAFTLCILCGTAADPKGAARFLGRWDITVPAPEGGRARFCWLEVTQDGSTLKGRFNSGGGAQFALSEISVANGELTFAYPQGRPPDQTKVVWKAAAKGGKLEGTAALGAREGSRTWTGVRAPKWPAKPPKRKPGTPMDLFNGKDVTGWVGQIPNRALGWSVKDGILRNQDKGANNIYSEKKFNDFKLEVEFNVAEKSNSGIYLRGRYEIQVADGYGQKDLNVHSQGALYGYVIPPVNACKPAGEWQTYEITLVANRVTVTMNGIKIMENAEVPGITGGALDASEGAPGPIMIQGDHGKVQFRKIRVTPLI